MTYPETIQYLESFINYEKIPAYPYKESLKLERLKDFLAAIDNPQDNLKCIHVAGTKGKGSTCAFLTYILREAGYKAGLYTSPHLLDFRERIRILNPQSQIPKLADFEGMISEEELARLATRLKSAIDRYNKDSKYGPLSFFEVYTSLAFVYFKEKKVDFAVLETGLGGRLDATNVVKPLICAITPISYEHTQKLGNTLRELAAEKAGIIKVQSSIVITAPQEEEAMEVIRNRCREIGTKLYEVGKDIIFAAKAEASGEQSFSLKGEFGNLVDLKIRLLGRHQIVNAAVAAAVIAALRYYDINIGIDSLKGGLYHTVWPGRCEVIRRNPLVVLDGAQNVASAKALKETIKENFSAESAVGGRGGKYKKLILVLGISSDKDIKGICNELYELADSIILTQSNNPRATPTEYLAQYFDGRVRHKTNNVKEAGEVVKRIAKKEDLILVTGSLFVVGEFRNGKI